MWYLGWIYENIGLYKWEQSCGESSHVAFFAAGVVLTVIISYLLGSLNSAIIVSKIKYKDDIRNYGSKNAGLTNMHRVYGLGAAGYTLLGDALKTMLSIVIGSMLFYGMQGAYLGALFCIIGHVFPIYYKFRGGKGVLASAVAILMLDPIIFLILLAVFIITVAISRYISLGSVLSGFIYPALIYVRNQLGTFNESEKIIPFLFAIFIGLFLIITHRKNLQRIQQKKENKFSFKKKPQNASSDNATDEDDDDTEYVVGTTKKDDE